MILILLILLLLLVVSFVGFRLYLSPSTNWCKSQRCLLNKTVVITGGNTGIGFETAVDLAKRGAKVILACRNPKTAAEARLAIIDLTDNPNVFTKTVDMASFKSVRNLARDLKEMDQCIDILVNNAGTSFSDGQKTEDGYELTMQVNYYSHFLLTLLLLDLLKKSQAARIVNVSSLAASYAPKFDINNLETFTSNTTAYANSKLCQLLFTKELAERLQNTNVSAFSLHPGVIKTDIFRTTKGITKILINSAVTLFYKPVNHGAQTSIYCSVEKNLEGYSGHHFDNCRKVKDYGTVNVDDQKKLWDFTSKIVQLQDTEMI